AGVVNSLSRTDSTPQEKGIITFAQVIRHGYRLGQFSAGWRCVAGGIRGDRSSAIPARSGDLLYGSHRHLIVCQEIFKLCTFTHMEYTTTGINGEGSTTEKTRGFRQTVSKCVKQFT